MSNSKPEIDKEFLYGNYYQTQRWRDNLSRKSAHQALDIPEDDMNINVRNGIGWKDILAAAALGGILYALLADRLSPPPQPPPVVSPAVAPAEDVDTTRRIWLE